MADPLSTLWGVVRRSGNQAAYDALAALESTRADAVKRANELPGLTATIDEFRHALTGLAAAARKVPIVSTSKDGEEPWLTCLGCGSVSSMPCVVGCWVNDLETAIEAAETALSAVRPAAIEHLEKVCRELESQQGAEGRSDLENAR